MKTLKPAEPNRYSHSQVAQMYGVCRQTLYRWLKPIAHELGKRKGNCYSVEQINIIFSYIGVPMMVVIADSMT